MTDFLRTDPPKLGTLYPLGNVELEISYFYLGAFFSLLLVCLLDYLLL